MSFGLASPPRPNAALILRGARWLMRLARLVPKLIGDGDLCKPKRGRLACPRVVILFHSPSLAALQTRLFLSEQFVVDSLAESPRTFGFVRRQSSLPDNQARASRHQCVESRGDSAD